MLTRPGSFAQVPACAAAPVSIAVESDRVDELFLTLVPCSITDVCHSQRRCAAVSLLTLLERHGDYLVADP